MGIFKAIKNFFTGASVEAPFEPDTKVAPVIDTTTNWPFPRVRPEDTIATSEVAIKPAPKKKRSAKPKAEASAPAKAEPKAKPAVITAKPKSKPAPVKAAPAPSTSKRVRKTKPKA